MKSTFDPLAFKEKLESFGTFPMPYLFKFIVPFGKESEIAAIFPKDEVVLKPSSGGKYISITIHMQVDSADQVIELYEMAAQIDGVISL
jgi:putative lipoic acid-binding regulatory protein